MTALDIRQSEGGVVFHVKVVPGSSRTAIAGELDGALKVKVSAAPEKGKANQCLIGFLARKLGVKKKSISIISGAGSCVKQLHVNGVAVEEVAEKIAPPKKTEMGQ